MGERSTKMFPFRAGLIVTAALLACLPGACLRAKRASVADRTPTLASLCSPAPTLLASATPRQHLTSPPLPRLRATSGACGRARAKLCSATASLR